MSIITNNDKLQTLNERLLLSAYIRSCDQDPYLNNTLIRNRQRTKIYRNYFDSWLRKLRVGPTRENKVGFICFNKNPLKMTKNAFNFI